MKSTVTSSDRRVNPPVPQASQASPPHHRKAAMVTMGMLALSADQQWMVAAITRVVKGRWAND